MRFPALAILVAVTASGWSEAQIDWPVFGGDSQRSGWEKSDTRITHENVKDFELLLKRKFAYAHTGPRSLTPPVIVGLLISYRGFKELAFVGDASGAVWSVDADLNRVFWKRQFPPAPAACADGVAEMPALVPPVVFGKKAGAGKKRPAIPGNGFGEVRPVFAVSNDGKLHKLNTSDGTDLAEPLDFLPARVKGSPLTIHDGTIYATSVAGCSAKTGLWAIDLTVPEPKAVSFTWEGAGANGLGGPAFGSDGTVYVQTGPNAIQSLSANDLTPKESAKLPANEAGKAPAGLNVPTPVVIDWNGRDLVAAASSDGKLVLLDSQALGGAPLSQTQPLAAAGGGIWGALASWKDAAGKFWVFAPVWGKLNPDAKLGKTNGDVKAGAIAAFTVEEELGKPVLTPAWVSRDMQSPVPPVLTSGAVFVLSTGGKGSGSAVLYGLDAQTGEELYTSGQQVAGPGALTGLTVSNGRVYFATADGTLYAFGPHFEI